jgi:hypothetical protein
METNPVVSTEVPEDGEVMAAVENGRRDRFIIADVTEDEAYVTLPLNKAASLPAWR